MNWQETYKAQKLFIILGKRVPTST